MRRALKRVLHGLALILVLPVSNVGAGADPVAPCHPGEPVADPPFAGLGASPAVAVFYDIELRVADCIEGFHGPMDLAVALSGRFRSTGGLEEIAARAGAISAMVGMRYWSVTDGDWRELVSEAYAVSEARDRGRRADFTAAEVLSGRALHFVQDDTRSSGLNLYSLRARRIGDDGLAIAFVNLTPIDYLLVPLFDPGALVFLQIVRHLRDDEWGYFGLSAVRAGAGTGGERSWINRAAAYHRLLTGEPTDGAPPLAP